jgi:uncharacterized protein (TIGR03083 family)
MANSELVGRILAALRSNHEALAGLVRDATDDQLAAQSGADAWNVAQVLSHLGSGAEINRRPIARAAGLPVDEEENQTVWGRWDAATPAEQAAGFLEHDEAYLDTVEQLTTEQRESLSVHLGYLPGALPLVVVLAMRLNEMANHAWDARVGLDRAAGVDEGSAALLLELYAGPLDLILGWAGKADRLDKPARVAVPGGGILIDEAVSFTTRLDDPTATFDGSQEEVVRLLSGRLRPPYADGVRVIGDLTLDDLREVFPGY